MFSRKDRESSTISMFVEKKTRLFKSKIDFALHGEHIHYFNKKDTKDTSINPACKVCGMLLSDLKIQKKFESLNNELKTKKT